jgi:hypothetical protein
MRLADTNPDRFLQASLSDAAVEMIAASDVRNTFHNVSSSIVADGTPEQGVQARTSQFLVHAEGGLPGIHALMSSATPHSQMPANQYYDTGSVSEPGIQSLPNAEDVQQLAQLASHLDRENLTAMFLERAKEPKTIWGENGDIVTVAVDVHPALRYMDPNLTYLRGVALPAAGAVFDSVDWKFEALKVVLQAFPEHRHLEPVRCVQRVCHFTMTLRLM